MSHRNRFRQEDFGCAVLEGLLQGGGLVGGGDGHWNGAGGDLDLDVVVGQ